MVLAKTQIRSRIEADNAQREKKIAQLNDFIARFSAGTRSSQVQSRRKEVERLQTNELARSNIQRPYIKFQMNRPSGRTVLEMKGLDKGYDGTPVVSGFNAVVSRGEKIVLVGRNGVGKTTLLKALLADAPNLPPSPGDIDGGSVRWGHEVSVGYFAQDHTGAIEKGMTAVEWLHQFDPDAARQDIHGLLGQMLFSGEEGLKPTDALSGGETARLLFCRIMLQKPNVLVLDEPTNHLDLESINALNIALQKFEGTVLLVTHDQDLLEEVGTRVWHFDGRTIPTSRAPTKSTADARVSVRRFPFDQRTVTRSRIAAPRAVYDRLMRGSCVAPLEPNMPAKTPAPATGFGGLGLRPDLVESITALGYEEPTPVQSETIPLLLEGRDLLAQAATGTGKTAAFALPMLQRISDGPAGRHTSGLVLVPTRELAMQVAEAVHKYARGEQLSVLPLYGGAPMHQQIRALERGAAVVVATPGRALDHIRRRTLALDKLQVLVLDEADEMLDMGFAEDLDAILEGDARRRGRRRSFRRRCRRESCRSRNATCRSRRGSPSHARRRPPASCRASARSPTSSARPHKAAALERVLEMENPASALVFCRTRLEVDTLVEMLNAHGHRAEALHGGMEQRLRDRVMGRFREGTAELLVATDVAARGLDIERLSHVVNYDVPSAAEAYVHRIGRTGRAGPAGTAITLAEPREHRLLRSIESADEAEDRGRHACRPSPTCARSGSS